MPKQQILYAEVFVLKGIKKWTKLSALCCVDTPGYYVGMIYLISSRHLLNFYKLLDRHILNSSYSLPEVRILFEIYHHSELTASEIIDLLSIDKGYLSRILKRFEKNKIIKKVPSTSDKRTVIIELSTKGKKEFEALDNLGNKQVEKIFDGLVESACIELIQRMKRIQQILSKELSNE